MAPSPDLGPSMDVLSSGPSLVPFGPSPDTPSEAIVEWPVPWKVKDIQSFLGFCNFYWRFIYNYAAIAIPLTWLTQKNIDWVWSDKCQLTFDTLKQAFTEAPVLHHWVPGWQINLKSDASNTPLLPFYPSSVMTVKSTPLCFGPGLCSQPNSTTTCTTRNSWKSLTPSHIGVIISKALPFRSMLSWTTRIWSIL
jgi:hypothetical protein